MSERTEIDDIQRRVVHVESLVQTLGATVQTLGAAVQDIDSLVNKIWDEIRPPVAASATLTITPNS